MNLTYLESFVETVRRGSFSGAARSLSIPKSTVATRVDALEDEMATRLLERTTRQVRPTPEGSLLYQRSERLLAEARDLKRMFQEYGSEPRGTLRVSVPALFEQEYMAVVAAKYVASFPELRIEVVPDDRRVDLLAEGFDCAIRVGALEDSTAVVRTFAHTSNLVVAAPSLVQLHGEPAALEDLAQWPAIWVGRDNPATKIWEILVHERPVMAQVNPSLCLGSLRAAHAAALHGAGAALLPDFLVAQDLNAGKLRILNPTWGSRRIPLSVLFPMHRQASLRLRLFIDTLSAQFPDRALPPSR